jgi:hypothetical protein
MLLEVMSDRTLYILTRRNIALFLRPRLWSTLARVEFEAAEQICEACTDTRSNRHAVPIYQTTSRTVMAVTCDRCETVVTVVRGWNEFAFRWRSRVRHSRKALGAYFAAARMVVDTYRVHNNIVSETTSPQIASPPLVNRRLGVNRLTG